LSAAPLTVYAAPAVNKKEQRDQGQFPEYVEQGPILGHEDPEHGGFQQQHQHVVTLHLLFDAGRCEQGDKAEEGGEQQHGEGDAIDADSIGGAEPGIPNNHFHKLESW